MAGDLELVDVVEGFDWIIHFVGTAGFLALAACAGDTPFPADAHGGQGQPGLENRVIIQRMPEEAESKHFFPSAKEGIGAETLGMRHF